jgi:protoporphyrinogen oxidase
VNVVVVGAGISGLTAAFRIQQSGHHVRVLEAAEHPGGRMWTKTPLGLSLDTGAHLLLDSYERTKTLVAEVGLADRWIELPDGEGGVVHDRHLASFSPGKASDVLGVDGMSLVSRARLFVTLLEASKWKRDLDFFDLSVGDAPDTEDCDTFARRHLGDEATDYVVDSFIRTFHFHGARRMSAKYFEALAALLLSRGKFRPCALRGHMKTLPLELAQRVHVEYGIDVRSIEPFPDGVEVEWSLGRTRCDAVVLATPAEITRPLLASPTAPQRDVLRHATCSSTILCAYSVPVETSGHFEGVWVPFRESSLVSGVSNDLCEPFESGPRRVISAWLHEEGAAELQSADDASISRAIATEVGRLLPQFSGALTALSVERIPLAIPVYAVGQVTRVAELWRAGQGENGVWLCGDYLNHPWVEGAVRCGEKVAAGVVSKRW